MLKKAECRLFGETEKVGGIIVPLSLLSLSTQSPNFLVTQAKKFALFLPPKKLKPLLVNAFRFNQQTIVRQNRNYRAVRKCL
ncbi:hypothetical protein [Dapis sp. BLCC M229]|uniref:hypothetical protein n=1 Tax=Dapis sp. BLCC M229 TaxID=3400188 RepID=UPI003CEFBC32